MSAGEFHTGHEDVDVVLMVQIEEADDERRFSGVEAVAVRAIIALSRAGADLMLMAVHARNRDVEQLSQRARGQLDQARQLMTELVEHRRAPAAPRLCFGLSSINPHLRGSRTEDCPEC